MAGVSQVSHLVHVENSSSKDEYDHHKDIPHTATGLGQKQNDCALLHRRKGNGKIYLTICKNSVMQGHHCT